MKLKSLLLVFIGTFAFQSFAEEEKDCHATFSEIASDITASKGATYIIKETGQAKGFAVGMGIHMGVVATNPWGGEPLLDYAVIGFLGTLSAVVGGHVGAIAGAKTKGDQQTRSAVARKEGAIVGLATGTLVFLGLPAEWAEWFSPEFFGILSTATAGGALGAIEGSSDEVLDLALEQTNLSPLEKARVRELRNKKD